MLELLKRAADFAVEYSGALAAASVLSIAIGAVLVPAFIVRLPADYFAVRRRHSLAPTRRHPLAHIALVSAKNVVGAVFVLAGVLLLVLPGQGLITILTGLFIMNYPGKFEVERWLVRRAHVLPALNWLRARFNRPPLLAPDEKPRPQPEM